MSKGCIPYPNDYVFVKFPPEVKAVAPCLPMRKTSLYVPCADDLAWLYEAVMARVAIVLHTGKYKIPAGPFPVGHDSVTSSTRSLSQIRFYTVHIVWDFINRKQPLRGYWPRALGPQDDTPDFYPITRLEDSHLWFWWGQGWEALGGDVDIPEEDMVHFRRKPEFDERVKLSGAMEDLSQSFNTICHINRVVSGFWSSSDGYISALPKEDGLIFKVWDEVSQSYKTQRGIFDNMLYQYHPEKRVLRELTGGSLKISVCLDGDSASDSIVNWENISKWVAKAELFCALRCFSSKNNRFGICKIKGWKMPTSGSTMEITSAMLKATVERYMAEFNIPSNEEYCVIRLDDIFAVYNLADEICCDRIPLMSTSALRGRNN